MNSAKLTDEQLRTCIFRGLSLLVGIVTLIVGACVYVPFLDSATGTPLFTNVAIGSMVVAVLLSLLTFFRKSPTLNRSVKLVFLLALTLFLVVVAQSLSSKAVVLVSMVAASVVMGIAAYAGSRMRDASWMRGPLLVGFLVLFLSGLLNIFVFSSNWMETAYSILAIVVFTIASVYETNMFVKHRYCRYDCCEEGVFSLFGNFANIAANLMQLND